MLRSLFLAFLLCSTSVLAQSPLSAADKAFDNLEFDRAAQLYKQALSQPGTQTERVRAYRGLGLSQAFMGESRAAKVSFERLLMLKPDATVDSSLGPKITGPFEAARKAGRKASLTYERNASSGELTVRLKEDIPLTHELQVHLRSDGMTRFSVHPGPPNAPLSVETDPAIGTDVYIQAMDVNEGVLYEVGTAAEPLRFGPKAVADGPFNMNPQAPVETVSKPFPKWPIWVGIGVAVAAGAGVGVYFATKPRSPTLPDADKTITLDGIRF